MLASRHKDWGFSKAASQSNTVHLLPKCRQWEAPPFWRLQGSPRTDREPPQEPGLVA